LNPKINTDKRRAKVRRIRFFLLAVTMTLTLAAQLWASGAGPGMSPDEALSKLKDGNARYVTGAPQHPNQDQQRRAGTASAGQHPFATVLGCSDSRVPVEVLFDSGIGDIFVIRVAGNVAAVDETGSIEYAVEHLGTPAVVVLGHTQCGAVTAAVQNAEVHGNIRLLVNNIKPAVAKAHKMHPEMTGDALLNEAIRANVWQSIADLFKSSPVIAEKIKAGQLKVVGAMYTIDSGVIQWMGPHPMQDQLLAQYGSKPAHKKNAPRKSHP
jgi:carbonic anhydrase